MALTGEKLNVYVASSPISMLLYGIYGSGKTVLTASAQQNNELKDLIYIDADPGVSSVEGSVGFDQVNRIGFDTIRDLQSVPAVAKQKYPKGKTIVFDSITEVVNIRLAELWSKRKPDPETGQIPEDYRDYLVTGKEIMNMLANIRSAGYNIILTANAKDETELVDKKPVFRKRRPDLPPRIFAQIALFVDFMWHTYKSVDNTYNLLYLPYFSPSGAEIVAKTRRPQFVEELNKIQRNDFKGAINIGVNGKNPTNYPNLNTLYALYKSTLGDKNE